MYVIFSFTLFEFDDNNYTTSVEQIIADNRRQHFDICGKRRKQ